MQGPFETQSPDVLQNPKTLRLFLPPVSYDSAISASYISGTIPCMGLASRVMLRLFQAITPMLQLNEPTRYEAMQDEWEDKQPQHTPCWKFEILSKGIYDWTTDEAELNGWIKQAIACGQGFKKTFVSPF